MVAEKARVLEILNPNKWHGCVRSRIPAAASRVWKIASDFCGLHKIMPVVDVCERPQGQDGAPGCVRFYTMDFPARLPGGRRKAWAKDRLVSRDNEKLCFVFQAEGNNLSLEDCLVNVMLYEGMDKSTIVNWSFEVSARSPTTKDKALGDLTEFANAYLKGLEMAAMSRSN
ncbi:lachrymatory-factor synthase [Selaginella moellendorffii]|uniref:lachrymatory-factor synthase n=1 Tax=Selaginella moellendorffii TaxID=88036 RepID=UPI000D1CEE8D|nr:lachrymatory-factor synthase [Selaginella moellendorffii]|eukprot:XP_024540234.1 lachrymatory-factor synthase [Selaginella moellendorffii]